MGTALTWTEICSIPELQGHWVALDHCQYDGCSTQPVAGVVVDSDGELGELCARMRSTGHSSCAIVFCGEERRSRTSAISVARRAAAS